ncbi:hypothetical protein [Neobacillus drentensis]|uniref:hypothetical protein n=1 Tax=Neobacillus drentensis TaxID=220684 RepID=UPI003001308F
MYVLIPKRLLELDIHKVFPGHGEDINIPKELINLRLKRQYERSLKVRELHMEER